MKIIISMSSLRNEFITKKCSKDTCEFSTNFKRKMGESNRLTFFLSGVYSLFRRCYKG